MQSGGKGKKSSDNDGFTRLCHGEYSQNYGIPMSKCLFRCHFKGNSMGKMRINPSVLAKSELHMIFGQITKKVRLEINLALLPVG